MQRRLGLSPRTTPGPHAANNRNARVAKDKIKHRRVGMDRNLGRAGSRTPGDKDGSGGNSNDKNIVQSGDETDIPSPLSSRASSSAEMDQDTIATTSANSSSIGMTSWTVRSTMPRKNLTASRKKRPVATAPACRQLAAATSKQIRQSAWAMKPTESHRQAAERRTPAAKVYPRAKAAAEAPSKTTSIVKSTSSRPKGTPKSKRVVEGGDGGSGRSPGRKRETPGVSASRHMAWERQLRASTTAGASNPDRTKDAAGRRGRQKADKNGGGERDGRPSLGTWEKTIVRLEILKKITGKGDEELEWLCSAKKGDGIQKSETRRDCAETDYHRVLFQESMLQAGMEILKDRRLEVSLKTLAKMGGDLERLTKLHEQLAEEEASLTTVNAEDKVDGDEATMHEAESAAAPAAVMASLQRDRLGLARVDAEAELRRVLEGISGAQEKVLLVGHGLKEEVAGGTRKVFGECKSALETAIGRLLLQAWQHVADEERAWFDREAAANEQALRRMRSLMPVGVTGLTLSELEQRAIDAGSLYPRELSARLKMPVGVTGLTLSQLKRAIDAGSLYPKDLSQ
ncbi:unnamed protein product [Ectocarpus sp. CCAP 1310/34]|nr:unnamed protein product [Ectocarpus sp. CCAP 1310/34]